MRPKTREIIIRTIATLQYVVDKMDAPDIVGLRLSHVVNDLQDCVKDLADESVHQAMNQPCALKGVLNDIVKSFK